MPITAYSAIFLVSSIVGGSSLLASSAGKAVRGRHPIVRQVQQAFLSAGLCNKNRTKKAIPWRAISTKKVRSGNGEGLLQGYKIVMRYSQGRTVYDVQRELDRISEWLGATIRAQDERGRLALYVYDIATPVAVPFTPELLARIRGTWEVPVGLSEHGWVFHDFAKAPHVMIGGETGGGKTNYLTMMLYALLRTHKQSDMQLHIIDMKYGLSFRFLGKSPYLAALADGKGTTIDRLTDALLLVQKVREVMHRQLALLDKWQVTSWQEAQVHGHDMIHHFLIVDEMAEISGKSKEAKAIVEQIWDEVSSLARLGRAAAVHVILCTQRPQVDVVPGDIKGNIDGRLAFRLPDASSSVTILGVGGAEQIPPIQGRAIYRRDVNTVVQTPKIDLASIRLRMVMAAKQVTDQLEFERSDQLTNEWVVE